MWIFQLLEITIIFNFQFKQRVEAHHHFLPSALCFKLLIQLALVLVHFARTGGIRKVVDLMWRWCGREMMLGMGMMGNEPFKEFKLNFFYLNFRCSQKTSTAFSLYPWWHKSRIITMYVTVFLPTPLSFISLNKQTASCKLFKWQCLSIITL